MPHAENTKRFEEIRTAQYQVGSLLQSFNMPGSPRMLPFILIIQILVAVLVNIVAAQDASCDYQQTLEDGQTYYLYNPNYPNSYRGENKCAWLMYTHSGNRIFLNCSVNLYRNSRSCIDLLTVEGSNSDSSFCTDFSTESSGQSMRVTFSSVASSPGGRFLCSVQTRNNNCDCGYSVQTRIVGGEETGINEFPMMVSLVDTVKRAPVCGATIISQTWVVSAAHCLDTLTPATTGVLVGEHDMRTSSESNATALFRASRFVIHPEYSKATTRNDIGLVQVARPIRYNARVGPVCLPFTRRNIPELGEVLTILGWGLTSFGGGLSHVLMKANIKVVPVQRCGLSSEDRRVSPTSQFCTFTSGKDPCQMDSGGPLLSLDPQSSRYFLAGLLSDGGACSGNKPSVNTWVYPYLGWIQAVTQDKFCIK